MEFEVNSRDENNTLLLFQLKKGCNISFNVLYKLYSKILYRNILHLVKEKEIAQELLQDLFLKVWEKRESIDTEKSFKSYLFTIAKNTVYDYFRKVSLDRKLKEKLMASAMESYSHTEEDISFKEKSLCLERAISILPPQSRRVYQLCKIDGLSHEEISQELNISISTINNHMVKSNKLVKEFIYRNSDLAVTIIAATFFVSSK